MEKKKKSRVWITILLEPECTGDREVTEGDVVFSFCFRGDRDQGERGDNGRRTEITEPGKIIIHSYRNNNTE